MKDTTAILVHYSDHATLHQALNSLKRIKSTLKSIIILHELKTPPNIESGHINYVNESGSDRGQLLNEIICELNTSYVLFLHNTDYLSPTIHPDLLKLPENKTVLGTFYHNRDSVIKLPVLVRTSLLKKEKLPAQAQLPFEEALFPGWLSRVNSTQQIIRKDLVRQSRKNRFATTLQKEKIMQKYQLKKVNMHPTVSVIIATFNMGKYVEAAITSCLMQNDIFEQVLIMDDGSTDNSNQLLQRLGEKERVKVYRKKNGGKARALNELLPHVTSRFVLELDADDWLDPDASSVIKQHLSGLPNDASVLYGNLRKWKQSTGDILFKGVSKGNTVRGTDELLSYQFPLGPRIYRTQTLKKEGGFPVIPFEDGRLYEDVSVLNRLIKKYPFRYKDFTVYNVREHDESITKNNLLRWRKFLTLLKSQ